MGTNDTYTNILEALKLRLEAMQDANSNNYFEEVEYGRRGSFDKRPGGAYIIPPPRSVLIPEESRQFHKTWHQWNYLIFINYFGANEQETFDAVRERVWKVYDTLMEVETPAEGKGYNRSLWETITGPALIHTLNIYEINFIAREDSGWEQIAVVSLYVTLQI